ncbi:DinB family protein [Aquimarina algicola]|uniref:DinB family protein n=1 Tax=Aquimarina algicola TaxID=2589995 RepID=A0A504J786_9FLAO|nr:DinB family protein [Aquimarina algicola]TPN86706.1 DinB family protein [Aquimarina algicola]
MKSTTQIAKHLRDVHFGGNWCISNLKDTLEGVSWDQATKQIQSLNTIAALVYHTGYYIKAVAGVLEGKPLEAKDKYSFDHPPVQSPQDWEALLQETWDYTEKLAELIEKFPEEKLWDDFVDKKYGNYYRNFLGLIEHTHYHLGQIVLIKKLLVEHTD